MTDEKNRPLETLRDGNLKAAIWENAQGEKTSHSVQFRRSWRDQDGQMRDSDSLFGADLLRVARLAEQSYDRLAQLREQAREAGTPERDRQRSPQRERSRDRDRDHGR